MKLTFLGTGSAFTLQNYQSNMLLESGERKMLIDCGSDIRHSLQALKQYGREGLTYRDITDVYISHQHADHAGGLEWLAFCSFFDPSCPKPRLYAHSQVAGRLWGKTLAGGLDIVQGPKLFKLGNYFKYKELDSLGKMYKWGGMYFRLLRTVHVLTESNWLPSYGLFFECDGIKVTLTTDSQILACDDLVYQRSDLIFHDCETSPYRSGVHAHFTELCELPEEIKNRMWLYHYQDGPLPDAKANGFRGFVKRGQCFDFQDSNTW